MTPLPFSRVISSHGFWLKDGAGFPGSWRGRRGGGRRVMCGLSSLLYPVALSSFTQQFSRVYPFTRLNTIRHSVSGGGRRGRKTDGNLGCSNVCAYRGETYDRWIFRGSRMQGFRMDGRMDALYPSPRLGHGLSLDAKPHFGKMLHRHHHSGVAITYDHSPVTRIPALILCYLLFIPEHQALPVLIQEPSSLPAPNLPSLPPDRKKRERKLSYLKMATDCEKSRPKPHHILV